MHQVICSSPPIASSNFTVPLEIQRDGHVESATIVFNTYPSEVDLSGAAARIQMNCCKDHKGVVSCNSGTSSSENSLCVECIQRVALISFQQPRSRSPVLLYRIHTLDKVNDESAVFDESAANVFTAAASSNNHVITVAGKRTEDNTFHKSNCLFAVLTLLSFISVPRLHWSSEYQFHIQAQNQFGTNPNGVKSSFQKVPNICCHAPVHTAAEDVSAFCLFPHLHP